MSIRNAVPADAAAIRQLLYQLDYPTTTDFIAEKLPALLAHPDHALLVYEAQGQVVGMMSIHFIPQIALAGDFANICYFAVDTDARSAGIGAQLEAHCAQLARARNCDRIFVHCHTRREDAHRFYGRQGYEESPKYFLKRL